MVVLVVVVLVVVVFSWEEGGTDESDANQIEKILQRKSEVLGGFFFLVEGMGMYGCGRVPGKR